MAPKGVDAMWFLSSALNVNVKKFKKARVNGRSNYDSLKSIVTRGQAGYWSCLAQVTLPPLRGTAGNTRTSTSARGVLPRMWRRVAKRSVATKEREITTITVFRNGYLEPWIMEPILKPGTRSFVLLTTGTAKDTTWITFGNLISDSQLICKIR